MNITKKASPRFQCDRNEILHLDQQALVPGSLTFLYPERTPFHDLMILSLVQIHLGRPFLDPMSLVLDPMSLFLDLILYLLDQNDPFHRVLCWIVHQLS